ncbi:MAG: LysM peptidoglycan-binding domain-containing protein [Bacilli bacterium]
MGLSDTSHGGSDPGNQGNAIVEKDYALLISNYIKDRLDDLGIENIITRSTDRTISDEERVNIITSAFGNDKNVIVVSNHLNKGGEEGLEIIYALRNSDDFAEEIADQVTTSGGVVNKYYQLRDPENTQNDYYVLLRDTPDYETVMVEFGYVDNSNDASRIKKDYLKYAEAVVRAIAIYTGVKYAPLPGANYYVVVKGDSLWKIATSYGIGVDELKKANNLTSNNLNIGQLLFIPSEKEEETGVVYVVKSGDSLWKIANNYGISVSELKSYNNLTSDLLSIGQQLKIPSGGVSTIYIVKSGDSLWKIANNYGISVSELKSYNNLTSDLLSIGQQLKIPSS